MCGSGRGVGCGIVGLGAEAAKGSGGILTGAIVASSSPVLADFLSGRTWVFPDRCGFTPAAQFPPYIMLVFVVKVKCFKNTVKNNKYIQIISRLPLKQHF